MNRDSYFDSLRGFAILLVIAIHCYSGGDFESIAGFQNIAVREFCNIGVPLFLVISGYFIGKKEFLSSKEFSIFLRKQLARVYFPCIFWSIPIMLLWLYRGESLLISFVRVFCFSAFIPYYFIALIIQLYIITPLLTRFVTSKMFWVIVICVNSIAVLILCYFIIPNYEMPFVLLVSPFVYWLIFYLFGIYLSQNFINVKLCLLFALSLFLFLVQIGEAYYIGVGLKLTSHVWAFVVTALFMSEEAKSWVRKQAKILILFSFIGRYSFGVYLCHVYMLMIIPKVTLTDSWFINWFFTSSCSILLVFILGRFLPNNIIRLVGVK